MPRGIEGWLKFTLAVFVAMVAINTVSNHVTGVDSVSRGF